MPVGLSAHKECPSFVIGLRAHPEGYGVLIYEHNGIERNHNFVVVPIKLDGRTHFTFNPCRASRNHSVHVMRAPIFRHRTSAGIVEGVPKKQVRFLRNCFSEKDFLINSCHGQISRSCTCRIMCNFYGNSGWIA